MNDRHGFGFARTAICVAVAMAAAPVLAQNTTAAVGGRVTAADGKPLAGAAVSIRHVESGSVQNTVTDADGRYAVRGLRVGGPYSVTFTKDGQSEKQDNVFLTLAETTTLDSVLGAPAAQVVVTGQAQNARFNSSSMGAGTNVGQRELNSLASVQRNLQDYARVDPRVSQVDKESGQIAVAGQNNRFNSITIDGVAINDTFGLEGNNLPTKKQPISVDAIQSVQVNVSNYDVTQKGYTGANINAVTKSGTNDFHGSVYYVYRDENMVGDRYNRITGAYTPAPGFQEDTKGVTIGGPIIKDKLFFFGSYEELRSTKATPDVGPVGGTKTSSGITSSAIASAAQIAKSTYGLDVGTFEVPSSAALTVKDALLKLDWNINDNHRANIRYTKTEQSDPSFNNLSSNQLSFSSNWHQQDKTLETVVGQWFADWTPNFSTELKISKRDYESAPTYPLRTPQVNLTFTGPVPSPDSGTRSRSLYFGAESSRHFNVLRTDTLDTYLAGTLQMGAHELKFGIDQNKNEIFNAFLQNTLGSYTFGCINSSATFQYSFGNITCSTATTAQIEAAVLENYQRGRPLTFTMQAPVAGKTINDGAATWSLIDTGLFLQDTWKVNKQLTLQGGVRFDRTTTDTKPAYNAKANDPVVPGVVATNTRQTGGFGLDNSATLDGETLAQPRFGFNYNFAALQGKRSQLRGGFGLFQGAAATVWLSNPYSNTGVPIRTIACGGSSPACPTADGTYNPDPDKQPSGFTGTQPQTVVDFVQKGLGQPSVWKLNLGFEQELPWYGMVASAEWLHTKTNTGIYYQHLNLGTPTRTGTDGRSLYYTAQAYDPRCWSEGTLTTTGTNCTGARNKSLSNAAYGNILYATETKKGGGDSLTLALNGSGAAGLGWGLAFTRTTATEVSPLTSSTSSSNFNGRSTFNPNEEVEANSNSLIRNRFNASLTYSKAFVSNYRTTLGLFYEARSGRPYSWTYYNDMNGDGVLGNDLMYIPSGPGSGEVTFAPSRLYPTAAAAEAAFWSVVEAHPDLNNSRGRVVNRNASFSRYVSTFDMRLSQEVPGFLAGHKGVLSFDFFNVGNMINKRWGRIDEVEIQGGGWRGRSFVNYGGLDANGKYVYSVGTVEDLFTRQLNGDSQWAVQVTLKYEF